MPRLALPGAAAHAVLSIGPSPGTRTLSSVPRRREIRTFLPLLQDTGSEHPPGALLLLEA